MKAYLPLPYGEHGMVFEINRQQGRLVLLCLAFGERHPTGHPSVYQIADQRLHRAEWAAGPERPLLELNAEHRSSFSELSRTSS